jgi:hypothetical protein
MNKKIRIPLLLGMMLMSQAINAQCRDLDTKKLAKDCLQVQVAIAWLLDINLINCSVNYELKSI